MYKRFGLVLIFSLYFIKFTHSKKDFKNTKKPLALTDSPTYSYCGLSNIKLERFESFTHSKHNLPAKGLKF